MNQSLIVLILGLNAATALAQEAAAPLRLPFGGAMTQDVARRRAGFHRSECEARWRGLEARGRADVAMDVYVDDCMQAQRARCHPRGSDPACDDTRARSRPK